MKVCVYAIAKNEEKFVNRFMEAIGPGVDVYIGDTGSTDRTAELFSAYPNVTLMDCFIEPWRFDTARNSVIDRIPDNYDLYFSIDIDEVVSPGWLELLQGHPAADRFNYTYNWNHHSDGRPDVTFLYDKIHSREYRWIKPVHEVLHFTGRHQPRVTVLEQLVVDHFPDNEKTRGSYLPLLEASVEENPTDPRNAFYLGREYFFYGQYGEAIKELHRYLSLPGATWGSERSFAMQYIAKSVLDQDKNLAEFWLLKATMETTEREPFIALAEHYCGTGQYHLAYTAAERAYQIKHRPGSHYIQTHYAWHGGPEHLMAFALWHLGNRSVSKKYAIESVMQDPKNQMFCDNLSHYKEIADA